MSLTASTMLAIDAQAETKTINMIIAGPTGGGYDIYARFYAKHLQKELGLPVIVKYLPGAGGMVAARHALNDPLDGNYNVYMLQTNQFSRHSVPADFDPRQFKILGSFCSPNFILHCNPQSPLNWNELILGALAPGNPPYDYAYMMNKLLKKYVGIEFAKIVPGYSGTHELLLAVEKNEVHGMIWDVSSARAAVPDWFVTPGKHQILAQFGITHDRELRAPLIGGMNRTSLDLNGQIYEMDYLDSAALKLVISQQVFSKTLVMPPSTPDNAATLMGLAFIEIASSQSFKDDAIAHHIEISPVGPSPLSRILNEAWSMPEEYVRRATELCKP